MKLTTAAVTLAIAVAAWSSSARAIPITYSLSFTGSGFTCVQAFAGPQCTPFGIGGRAKIIVDSALLNRVISSTALMSFTEDVPFGGRTFVSRPPFDDYLFLDSGPNSYIRGGFALLGSPVIHDFEFERVLACCGVPGYISPPHTTGPGLFQYLDAGWGQSANDLDWAAGRYTLTRVSEIPQPAALTLLGLGALLALGAARRGRGRSI
jgi:hypothetical protein